jgi:hypothetical protein
MSEHERTGGVEADEPDIPIPVSWIAKEDLRSVRPELADQIKTLSAAQMAYIADKVGDALQDTYWIAVEIVLDRYFADTEADISEQPTDPDYPEPGAGSL